MSRATGRHTACAIAVVSLVAGLLVPGSAGAAAQPDDHGPRLHWGSCPTAHLRDYHAQCATLTVPLDYAHPGRAKVRLMLSRVRHTAPASRYRGVMLVTPGGPGDSGLDLATTGELVPHGVGADYDWVGFDPRGVGRSRPALSCAPDYLRADRPDYRPATTSALDAWLTRSRNYATACADHNGPLLAHMRSIDSVRDLARIRVALGVPKLSLYGFSYGTYLDQLYATVFPRRLRRMVLDSSVDPTAVWYRADRSQDVGFQRTIDAWFGWIAHHHGVYGLGSTRHAVAARFYAVRDHLARHPAGDRIGPDEWTDLFLDAASYQQSWVASAELFAGYVHHRTVAPLIAEFRAVDRPGHDNQLAAYTAVECSDAPWPRKWSSWQRDVHRIAADNRYETWGNTWYDAPCLYWHVPAHRAVAVDGRRAPPSLLVDETLDPVTPFAGSREVRRLFPRSRLVAVRGGTSTANSLSGNTCVDDRIASYLGPGTLPPRQRGDRADVICPRPHAPLAPVTVAAAGQVLPGVAVERVPRV